ncbi:hypothetical protein Lepto7375DRAFT_7362 [Leptolyngbya sp. PCC 7375]|nr:hypothetical protein Lepto7375DRAFT_7362 [Leptolyngbya sp. PCC 7375]
MAALNNLKIELNYRVPEGFHERMARLASATRLAKTPQCMSCSYYCGKTYGGNTLVCAVHPNGPEGECKDWEGDKKQATT